MRPSDHRYPIVCLTDVTDPEAAREHPCVRTLADEMGNRYVLLTTAQYLRLLRPGTGQPPAPSSLPASGERAASGGV